jgi:hypothetical protein
MTEEKGGIPPHVIAALAGAMDGGFMYLAQHPEATFAQAPATQLLHNDGTLPGNRTGAVVFVKVCRFSEKLLKDEPATGGLLMEKQRLDAEKKRKGGLILP